MLFVLASVNLLNSQKTYGMISVLEMRKLRQRGAKEGSQSQTLLVSSLPQLSHQSNGDGWSTYLIELFEGQISQYISVFRTVPDIQYIYLLLLCWPDLSPNFCFMIELDVSLWQTCTGLSCSPDVRRGQYRFYVQ